MGATSSSNSIKWPLNPDLKPVKAKINTYHPKYGKLVEGKTYKIDPQDFSDQVFDSVGWTPEKKQSTSTVEEQSVVSDDPSKTNDNVRRLK